MSTKYRSKPVIKEAIQWLGTYESYGKISEWMGYSPQNNHNGQPEPQELYIKTLEGEHVASKGDYIVKGLKGEFYPCKPDIFEMSYEPVSEPVSEPLKACPTIEGAQLHGLGFR